MASKKSTVLKWFGYLATLVAFIYIIRVFVNMEIDWSSLPDLRQGMIAVVLLAVLTVLQYLLQVFSWKRILSFLSKKKISYRPVLRVYMRANLGKYLPGNVMHFAGRNLLGRELGIGQADMALSTAAEIVLMGISGTLLVLVLAHQDLIAVVKMILETPAYRTVLVVVCCVGVLALILLVVLCIKKKSVFEKYKCFFSRSFLRIAVGAVLIYAVNFTAFGLTTVWTYKYVLGVQVTGAYYLPTISLTVLSWIAGHIIPGVPGGIGVRESISILLMGGMYGSDMSAMASVVARIISVLADLLGFAMTFLFGAKPDSPELDVMEELE